jgi:hypothetical protein
MKKWLRLIIVFPGINSSKKSHQCLLIELFSYSCITNAYGFFQQHKHGSVLEARTIEYVSGIGAMH